MTTIRPEIIFAVIRKADALTDLSIRNDLIKRYEFVKQTILDDESLTMDEKRVAIMIITKDYDYFKVLHNVGTKRLCENCALECLATLYCELCVRSYLKNDFSNWTSGNNNVDCLIQECQMKSFRPDKIIEWIPYSNLQDVKYITKGGCSKIYSAIWIDGRYVEWNPKEQQLKRFEAHNVILKKLVDVERANKNWFEEVIILILNLI
jgi:hypothetical protein